MEIEGTTALVTGGGSGLGAATVATLVKAGVFVAVLDKNADALSETAASHGADVVTVAGDVRNPDDVTTLLALLPSDRPLRSVVNCAGMGIGPTRTVARDGTAHDYDAFRLAVDVNLHGTFNVSRLAASYMSHLPAASDGSRGCIVNTASCAAFDGQVGQVAYSAAKAAIVGMTLPLARDLAPLGIRVNTIAPGAFDTPIFGPPSDAVDEFQARLLADATFPVRMGQPDEFAGLVEHLLRNDYANATTIRLDAGIRMRAKP